MARRTVRFAVGLAALSLAVAACTTAAEPGASAVATSTSTSVGASSTATGVTTSVPTATSPSSGIAVIPNENSVTGAQQFVSYYIDQLNQSLKDAEPQRIDGLASASCQTCSTWTSRAQSLKASGQHLTDDLFTVTSVTTTRLSDASAEVLVLGEQKGADVVNADGTKLDTVPKILKANFLFSLNYDRGWKVGLWQTA